MHLFIFISITLEECTFTKLCYTNIVSCGNSATFSLFCLFYWSPLFVYVTVMLLYINMANKCLLLSHVDRLKKGKKIN